MTMKPVIAAILVAAFASPAVAQEFSGGEIGLEYNINADDTSTDVSSYNAGVEFSFGREYAISVTAANLDIGDSDSATRLTLHGLYHLNPGSTVGLFYSADEDDVAGYGVQGGTVLGLGEIGGYIGQRSVADSNATIVGFESRTQVADQITFFTDFDIASFDEVTSTTSELGVSYLFEQGPEAYVQVGRQSLSGDDIEDQGDTYIGIGARISFGAKRGTTFESR